MLGIEELVGPGGDLASLLIHQAIRTIAGAGGGLMNHEQLHKRLRPLETVVKSAAVAPAAK